MKSSHPTHQQPSKEMIDAAVEWLLEQQEGFAAGRVVQFEAWRDADPRHALALVKAERTVKLLGGLPEMKASLAAHFEEEVIDEPRTATRQFWRRAAMWTAVAAGLVIATALFTRWRGTDGNVPEFRYVSNAERPQKLVLEDGSFVDLNANTTIRTQMMPRERRIALQEGEAHFAVAHDAARPFIVEAAGVTVRAVGTAFNVRVREQRVEVLVTEGKVEITDARTGTAPASERPPVGVGERVVVSRGTASPGFQVEKADPRELREATSWHSSVTTISSRPLREIVELFNRRNALRLVIADAELAERNLGGSFALNQPGTFVRALELEGDVVAQPRGENEIVLRLKR